MCVQVGPSLDSPRSGKEDMTDHVQTGHTWLYTFILVFWAQHFLNIPTIQKNELHLSSVFKWLDVFVQTQSTVLQWPWHHCKCTALLGNPPRSLSYQESKCAHDKHNFIACQHPSPCGPHCPEQAAIHQLKNCWTIPIQPGPSTWHCWTTLTLPGTSIMWHPCVCPLQHCKGQHILTGWKYYGPQWICGSISTVWTCLQRNSLGWCVNGMTILTSMGTIHNGLYSFTQIKHWRGLIWTSLTQLSVCAGSYK